MSLPKGQAPPFWCKVWEHALRRLHCASNKGARLGSACMAMLAYLVLSTGAGELRVLLRQLAMHLAQPGRGTAVCRVRPAAAPARRPSSPQCCELLLLRPSVLLQLRIRRLCSQAKLHALVVVFPAPRVYSGFSCMLASSMPCKCQDLTEFAHL